MPSKRPRILFLFPNEWDTLEMSLAGVAQDFDVIYEGFDRYNVLNRLQLAFFNPLRFVDRMVHTYGDQIDGVTSNDDHWGALLAALIAQRLGLPGIDPKVFVTCQHKALFRQAEQRVTPQQAPWFDVLEPNTAPQKMGQLPYPVFVKPVKSSFSVLARHVNSIPEMQQAIHFTPYEKLAQHVALYSVHQLHNHVLGHNTQQPSLRAMLVESPMRGYQINIDGYALDGKVHFVGIVDSHMFPGTHAFKRFEFPTLLDAQAIEAAYKAAENLLQGLGYNHGFFNVEAFVQRDTSHSQWTVQIIEVNPRMARQLSSLYAHGLGFDCWSALLALACNKPIPRAQGGAKPHAASFVRRSFDGSLPSTPSAAQLDKVKARFADARLQLYLKPRGLGMAREMKWVGSYRYAVTNMAAHSRAEMFEQYDALIETLGWLPDGHDVHLPTPAIA
jgi:hypothetical protein